MTREAEEQEIHTLWNHPSAPLSTLLQQVGTLASIVDLTLSPKLLQFDKNTVTRAMGWALYIEHALGLIAGTPEEQQGQLRVLQASIDARHADRRPPYNVTVARLLHSRRWVLACICHSPFLLDHPRPKRLLRWVMAEYQKLSPPDGDGAAEARGDGAYKTAEAGMRAFSLDVGEVVSARAGTEVLSDICSGLTEVLRDDCQRFGCGSPGRVERLQQRRMEEDEVQGKDGQGGQCRKEERVGKGAVRSSSPRKRRRRQEAVTTVIGGSDDDDSGTRRWSRSGSRRRKRKHRSKNCSCHCHSAAACGGQGFSDYELSISTAHWKAYARDLMDLLVHSYVKDEEERLSQAAAAAAAGGGGGGGGGGSAGGARDSGVGAGMKADRVAKLLGEVEKAARQDRNAVEVLLLLLLDAGERGNAAEEEAPGTTEPEPLALVARGAAGGGYDDNQWQRGSPRKRTAAGAATASAAGSPSQASGEAQAVRHIAAAVIRCLLPAPHSGSKKGTHASSRNGSKKMGKEQSGPWCWDAGPWLLTEVSYLHHGFADAYVAHLLQQMAQLVAVEGLGACPGDDPGQPAVSPTAADAAVGKLVDVWACVEKVSRRGERLGHVCRVALDESGLGQQAVAVLQLRGFSPSGFL